MDAGEDRERMIKVCSCLDFVASKIIAYASEHMEITDSTQCMVDLSINLIGCWDISSALCATVGVETVFYGHTIIAGSGIILQCG